MTSAAVVSPAPPRLSEPEPSVLAALAARAGAALPQPGRLDDLIGRWRDCYARFGQDPAGELSYRDLRLEFCEELRPLARPADADAGAAWAELCLLLHVAPSPPALDPRALARRRAQRAGAGCPLAFDRPLFILSAPRSGSTLLFETLARFPEVWTVGEESHELIEGVAALHPAAHGYASNRLGAADAAPATAAALRERFARRLLDRDRRAYSDLPEGLRPSSVRLLEKTPKNILRAPFLRAAFPGARFVLLYRRPEETLSSMLDGWRGGRFTAYRPLPGWPHRAWKFLLAPGWEKLAYRPLAEVVACQWKAAYSTALADLAGLPAGCWMAVDYARLVSCPQETLTRIAAFAEFEADARVAQVLAQGLPLSSMTFSAPDPGKWRKHAGELAAVLPGLREVAEAVERLCAEPWSR
jgi:hypothetical protein